MMARRVLALLVVVSLLAAWMPSPARAEAPTDAAKGLTEGFIHLVLRDPEIQQLLDSVVSELPAGTKEQLEQVAQLAVSGATPQDVEQQLQLIISSLPEATQLNLSKLILAVGYAAGLLFLVGALFKWNQHKNNPTQVTMSSVVVLLVILGSLLFRAAQPAQ